jgi:hypothetical protein
VPVADPLEPDNHLVVEHQHLSGLRASVNVLQMDAAPLSLPMFLVTLENRGGGEAGEDLNGNQLALWACLTRSEQRVARLAGQGRLVWTVRPPRENSLRMEPGVSPCRACRCEADLNVRH